jgi:hypothetical protein
VDRVFADIEVSIQTRFILKYINMKKIIFLLLFTLNISVFTFAQSTPHEKDSCAKTAEFQTSVRAASLTASYNLLADTSQHDDIILKYSQKLISDPQGGWVVAMSYGVLTNVVINCISPMNDIQFQVNSIFAFQAYAYYQVPPPNAATALQIRRSLNQAYREQLRKAGAQVHDPSWVQDR